MADRARHPLLRGLLLVGGCLVLGLGVALLLSAALGSDGFSTLVNGIALRTGMPFVAANTLVSAAFLALAWVRGLRRGSARSPRSRSSV